MSLESRLRTSSMLFKAKLGSLYVRDVMTKGSLFPVLVSPQQKRVNNKRIYVSISLFTVAPCPVDTYDETTL